MADRPTELPVWATSPSAELDTPPQGKQETGWRTGEKPPAEWFNWLFLTIYRWVDYLRGQSHIYPDFEQALDESEPGDFVWVQPGQARSEGFGRTIYSNSNIQATLAASDGEHVVVARANNIVTLRDPELNLLANFTLPVPVQSGIDKVVSDGDYFAVAHYSTVHFYNARAPYAFISTHTFDGVIRDIAMSRYTGMCYIVGESQTGGGLVENFHFLGGIVDESRELDDVATSVAIGPGQGVIYVGVEPSADIWSLYILMEGALDSTISTHRYLNENWAIKSLVADDRFVYAALDSPMASPSIGVFSALDGATLDGFGEGREWGKLSLDQQYIASCDPNNESLALYDKRTGRRVLSRSSVRDASLDGAELYTTSTSGTVSRIQLKRPPTRFKINETYSVHTSPYRRRIVPVGEE